MTSQAFTTNFFTNFLRHLWRWGNIHNLYFVFRCITSKYLNKSNHYFWPFHTLSNFRVEDSDCLFWKSFEHRMVPCGQNYSWNGKSNQLNRPKPFSYWFDGPWIWQRALVEVLRLHCYASKPIVYVAVTFYSYSSKNAGR